MYAMRKWTVSHAHAFNRLYKLLDTILTRLHPLWLKIGYDRVEKPIKFVEKNIKGFLFDCQMCGQCVLHKTGMSCPMNCPKELRNGPCGGVRPNGHCEVKPEMRCVWVEAYRGSSILGYHKNKLKHKKDKHDHQNKSILQVQLPVDHRLKGSSSWLREVYQKRNKEFFYSRKKLQTNLHSSSRSKKGHSK